MHGAGLIDGPAAPARNGAPVTPSVPTTEVPPVPARRNVPPPVPPRPNVNAATRSRSGSSTSLPTTGTGASGGSPGTRPPIPARQAPPTPAPRGTPGSAVNSRTPNQPPVGGSPGPVNNGAGSVS